jgi:hypothetical protein
MQTATAAGFLRPVVVVLACLTLIGGYGGGASADPAPMERDWTRFRLEDDEATQLYQKLKKQQPGGNLAVRIHAEEPRLDLLFRDGSLCQPPSKAEWYALGCYKFLGYLQINAYLRGDYLKELRQLYPDDYWQGCTELLASAFNKLPQKFWVTHATLYRGSAVSSASLARYVRGSQVVEKSFVSASFDRPSAEKYQTPRNPGDKPVLFTIHCRRGRRLEIGNLPANVEAEVVMLPGCAFTVTARDERNGCTYIDLNQL